MIIAYHAIFTTYGFWLPNDPRGSWSDWVRRYEILRYGPATKTDSKRSLAHQAHDYIERMRVKHALKYPAVRFDGIQARAVARGFAQAIDDAEYEVYACAILPDHVHIVIGRRDERVEKAVGHFKARASRRLREEGVHPLARFEKADGSLPSVWTQKPGWKVYLNTARDVDRAIAYVLNNPVKEGKQCQRWWFCTPFDVGVHA